MWPFRSSLGARGERDARRFLKRLGWRIIHQNYKCPLGEIDLIADDGEALVFVEVKTRAHDDDADPEINVDYRKRRQIERVAHYWLHAKGMPDRAYRFDVIAVVAGLGGKPDVRHIVEAFMPERRIG